MEKKTHQPSLASQRLKAALAICQREKASCDYHWLYVCARHQGEKIRAVWMKANENASDYFEHELGHSLSKATSFEVEMLHSPEVRELKPAAKNQWNSLRGKQAMEIKHGGKTKRWAATEMLARNLGFSNALNRHLADVKEKLDQQASIPVTLYQTRQWFCDNSPSSGSYVSPVELFRGNRVVEPESVNRESVLRCAQAMTRWLAAQVSDNGAASYKYWPSRGAYASSNNAIRQWMATACLGRAAKSFGSKSLAAIAAKNLEYNLSTTYRTDGKQSYIWMNGSGKLGAAALAALAILESPQRKQFLDEEYALHKLIHSLGNADGSFDTFYIPRERKDNQNFYSGEALLFLAARFSISRNPEELNRIMAAFHHYREWHRNNRNPAFIPWHTQAYYLVWQNTKDEELRNFIFEMNDWLLAMQQWESAEFPDMQGRFFDPARPYFGPPHASSTGVYLEGLIDAFALARQCGDQARAENYRIAIVRGIRSLMQLQYKDAVDCYYIKHVDRVMGGVRTTVYDNTIRIDNVQHGLMALLKIVNRFSSEDYSPIGYGKNVYKNNDSSSQKVATDNTSETTMLTKTENILCFRLKDFEVDIEQMRRDFEVRIRHIPATPYHHAGIPYEGWALTSRDGSRSDGVKRISGKERVLNGVKVEGATVPTELCTEFVGNILKQLQARGLKCFRVRYMKMGSEAFDMSFHRDAKRESWRLHIPLYTNEHCFFEWETKARSLRGRSILSK